ncbi:MAG: hypothetical protein C0524_05745 [Rhodobacter sp.]|nr:hypothetical protein [Rhodobacter sp.]
MRIVLWLIGGFVLGAALALGFGILLPYLTPVSLREGAYAMNVAFFMIPAGAVLGTVVGLIIGLTRRQR